MGLAGTKKRRKIAHDPQNVAWSRNATSFGHRQLLSQGWRPGQTLGASNAPQAEYFTTASSSHIRILFREDNLGLGAKPGSGIEHGECVGLGGLQDLLGRLNGKGEEAVERERRGREDVKRRLWAERRYGPMGFVSGGLLVGDDIVVNGAEPVIKALKRKASGEGRQVDDGEGAVSEQCRDRSPQKTKRIKKKTARKDFEDCLGTQTVINAAEVEDLGETGPGDTQASQAKAKERQDRRAEKAQRKADRIRRRLERRQRHKDTSSRKQEIGEIHKPATVEITKEVYTVPATAKVGDKNTVPDIPTSFASSRHAVRQKYIMQKKKIMLDPKALNEILMIKA